MIWEKRQPWCKCYTCCIWTMPSLPQQDVLYIHVKWRLFAVWFLEISITWYRQSLQLEAVVTDLWAVASFDVRFNIEAVFYVWSLNLHHVYVHKYFCFHSAFFNMRTSSCQSQLCLWRFNYCEYNGRITAGYSFSQHHLKCSATATVCFCVRIQAKSFKLPVFAAVGVWSNRRNQVRWNDSSGVSVMTEMLLLSEV